MEVNVRPLNKGETFCCSVKKAKELFRETAIDLNFAYLGRDFIEFAEHPVAYYWKRNIKGKIIASSLITTRQKKAIFSFYVLKEKDFGDELITEFEQEFLPKFYETYIKQLNDKSLTGNQIFMCVEFLDGKLKLHSTKI